MVDKQQFASKDLELAAFLYASGVTLLELDRSDPLNVRFIFETPDQQLLVAFQTSTATVNVRAHNAARKHLLNRLHGRGD